MLRNGLYSIRFRAGADGPEGTGVVVLHNGRLMGGDSALCYSGTYRQNGCKFVATVTTSRHAHHLPALFGLDNTTISFAGSVLHGGAAGFGSSAKVQDVRLEIFLSFQEPAELSELVDL
jgi:hypothetical protein